MAYRKPTEDQIDWALDNDCITEEEARRGYGIFDFDGTGLLEISRYDIVWVGWGEDYTTDVDDNDCAIEAERSGFCKIIPVEELPANFDRRYFGWIDTPENRKAIEDYCKDPDNYYVNGNSL